MKRIDGIYKLKPKQITVSNSAGTSKVVVWPQPSTNLTTPTYYEQFKTFYGR